MWDDSPCALHGLGLANRHLNVGDLKLVKAQDVQVVTERIGRHLTSGTNPGTIPLKKYGTAFFNGRGPFLGMMNHDHFMIISQESFYVHHT